ncbi:hypothetical protein [Tepidibacter formicigenes]|jgi:uncharacterized membrane protein YhaH (DUF805 family)|uniref:Uncharacterized protein n=1 Tax=Tepidibacter formicigenes DSM 15518 TaxID=1123349 RepID=A0A1M6U4N8_9FIRM|nr:hypothetical protein [Tepidibacter formicigenes]SHK64147.1 hypothetical protein SAMN02744037_02733 [Tepidibacter formicigenes DSM 15518]
MKLSNILRKDYFYRIIMSIVVVLSFLMGKKFKDNENYIFIQFIFVALITILIWKMLEKIKNYFVKKNKTDF